MRSTCFPNAGETGEFLRPAGKLEPLDLGAPGSRGIPCFKNSPEAITKPLVFTCSLRSTHTFSLSLSFCFSLCVSLLHRDTHIHITSKFLIKNVCKKIFNNKSWPKTVTISHSQFYSISFKEKWNWRNLKHQRFSFGVARILQTLTIPAETSSVGNTLVQGHREGMWGQGTSSTPYPVTPKLELEAF